MSQDIADARPSLIGRQLRLGSSVSSQIGVGASGLALLALAFLLMADRPAQLPDRRGGLHSGKAGPRGRTREQLRRTLS